MIITIGAEKALKNSTPIYNKNSPENGQRGNIP